MDKNYKCYMCKHFDRYFVKSAKQFNKTKCGWCCRQVTTKNIHDNCEQFTPAPKTKKLNGFIKYYLDGLLTEISGIRAVLEDNFNEDQQ